MKQVSLWAGAALLLFTCPGEIVAQVYGVKIDRSQPAESLLERAGDAVGLEAASQIEGDPVPEDDFSQVYPFSQLRVCNIKPVDGGGVEMVYSDEAGFSRSVDTFVEIPKFYMKRTVAGGIEERFISEKPEEGFFLAPMFVENGHELDKAYVAVYETSLVDGQASSVTGRDPLVETTLGDFRELYQAKGRGYGAMDIRTLMTLQHLYLVRFAHKNSQVLIGGGWTGLTQPHGELVRPLNEGTHQEIVGKDSWVYDRKYFVGQRICVINVSERGHPIEGMATLTGVKRGHPQPDQVTLYFDEPLTFTKEHHMFGGCPQRTGWTDSVEHDTGRSAHKNDETTLLCAVKLFHIENLWGNVWHQIDGLIIRGREGFVGLDSTQYNNEGEGYQPLGELLVLQPELGIPGQQFGNIHNLTVDPVFPWFGSAAEGFGEPATQDAGYGDFYYQVDRPRNHMMVHGGGFDHYERAGMFCMRNWNSVDHKWYLQGSRMQYKPLPQE